MKQMTGQITIEEYKSLRWANIGGLCGGRCEFRPITPQPTPCIVHDYDDGLRGRGYHGVYVNGKVRPAHRVEWEKRNGPIPDGLICCHKCDNPACFNVDHLFVGTYSDNSKDIHKKGRRPYYSQGLNPIPHDWDVSDALSSRLACSVICHHCCGFVRRPQFLIANPEFLEEIEAREAKKKNARGVLLAKAKRAARHDG